MGYDDHADDYAYEDHLAAQAEAATGGLAALRDVLAVSARLEALVEEILTMALLSEQASEIGARKELIDRLPSDRRRRLLSESWSPDSTRSQRMPSWFV